MPLQIVNRDITLSFCNVIVNPTDSLYSGSGGVDAQIHNAAGAGLAAACRALAPLKDGECAVTEGFRLNCGHIIHTAGPVWHGGGQNEDVILRSCYINCLLKAVQLGAESIAFPLISSGSFGFPKDMVLKIATDAISDFLLSCESDMEVLLCVLDRHAYTIPNELELENRLSETERREMLCCARSAELPAPDIDCMSAYFDASCKNASMPDNLGDWIKKQDDSFAVTLLKLIDKKHMTDVQCYTKANVGKKTFWKIKNDGNYKPSKPTVLAFAIALELSLEETEQLLKTVGFSLSRSRVFDMIIEYYISKGIYDIYEINAALYQYDQVCLGC